jgi:hypothetical protein
MENQNEQQIIIMDKINSLENQTDPYITQEDWPKFRRIPFQDMRVDLSLSKNLTISANNPYGCLNGMLNTAIANLARANLEVDELDINNFPKDAYDGVINLTRLNFSNNRDYFPNITDVSEEDLIEIIKLLVKSYYDFLEPYHYLYESKYYNTQGPTDHSLHFEFEEKENVLFKDYPRGRSFPDQNRRITSNLQIAAFYDRSLINCENIPNERILLFWIAFDNLIPLTYDEKTKLAQLLNTPDLLLTPVQKAIKEKINSKEFQNNVIKLFFESFKPWPKQGVTEITIDNIKENMPDKNHIIYIIHVLDKNLNKPKKQFKYIYSGQVKGLYEGKEYEEYYKSKHNGKSLQPLTQEQIKLIYKYSKIKPKVKFAELSCVWVIRNIKTYFENADLDLDDIENICSKKPFNKLNRAETVEFINTIRSKLSFLINNDENFPENLSEEQENILVDLFDLFSDGTELSREEKIELLKNVKKDDKFFETSYVTNPKFDKLGLDDEIKEFLSYLFDQDYDLRKGMTQSFKDAEEPQAVDILSILPESFQETVESFDLYKPPTPKEVSDRFTDCIKNAIIKIENEKIPFENWSYNHQKELKRQIAEDKQFSESEKKELLKIKSLSAELKISIITGQNYLNLYSFSATKNTTFESELNKGNFNKYFDPNDEIHYKHHEIFFEATKKFILTLNLKKENSYCIYRLKTILLYNGLLQTDIKERLFEILPLETKISLITNKSFSNLSEQLIDFFSILTNEKITILPDSDNGKNILYSTLKDIINKLNNNSLNLSLNDYTSLYYSLNKILNSEKYFSVTKRQDLFNLLSLKNQVALITNNSYPDYSIKGNGYVKAICENKSYYSNSENITPEFHELKVKTLTSAAIDKLSFYPQEKQIEIVHKITDSLFVENENLLVEDEHKSEIDKLKKEIIIQYCQKQDNFSIKAFVRGILEFNVPNLECFLEKILRLYGHNYRKLLRLITKITNDPHTVIIFKKILPNINYSIFIQQYNEQNEENKPNFIHDIANQCYNYANIEFIQSKNQNQPR